MVPAPTAIPPTSPTVVKCRLAPAQKAVIEDLKPLIRMSWGPDWAYRSRERQTGGAVSGPLESAGFHYIGEGMFRRGYEFNDGKCILKIAKGRPGMEHTRTENETWRNADEKLRPFLVPVADGDTEGTWNTMPAVVRYLTRGQMSKEDHDKAFRTKVLLDYLLERRGWACDDLHTGNIGRHHNMPIALDYGFGCERLSERNRKMAERRAAWGEWGTAEDEFDDAAFWGKAAQASFKGKGPEQVKVTEHRFAPPKGVEVVWGGSQEPPEWWKKSEARKRWFRERQPGRQVRKRSQWF